MLPEERAVAAGPGHCSGFGLPGPREGPASPGSAAENPRSISAGAFREAPVPFRQPSISRRFPPMLSARACRHRGIWPMASEIFSGKNIMLFGTNMSLKVSWNSMNRRRNLPAGAFFRTDAAVEPPNNCFDFRAAFSRASLMYHAFLLSGGSRHAEIFAAWNRAVSLTFGFFRDKIEKYLK